MQIKSECKIFRLASARHPCVAKPTTSTTQSLDSIYHFNGFDLPTFKIFTSLNTVSHENKVSKRPKRLRLRV